MHPKGMQVSGFHHLAIQVRDVEAVAAFYRDALGLSEMARHHRPDGSLRSIWVALPEGGFLAVEQSTPVTGSAPADTGFTPLALRIRREERAAWIAALSGRGVPVEHQTRWTIYFRDPEGNRVALSHHPFDPL
jgi:glyoxylase I family protein